MMCRTARFHIFLALSLLPSLLLFARTHGSLPGCPTGTGVDEEVTINAGAAGEKAKTKNHT